MQTDTVYTTRRAAKGVHRFDDVVANFHSLDMCIYPIRMGHNDHIVPERLRTVQAPLRHLPMTQN